MRLESVFELLLEASGVRESTIFHLGNSSGVEDSQLLPQFKNQRAACCALLKAIACPDVRHFRTRCSCAATRRYNRVSSVRL